ncbi:hypothetical protein PQU95_14430 [Vogesella sp. DC21W]|uniref:Uncharacterized protein n=1 Tax=Vogesella aquatica TaxID=2984206 RepID=A0ABT5J0Q3_9NEIS|nr:hypothetical protein [Vogesella aquatica]MDC7718406.1 hypothetical protein [Vogesella aquatica]
MSSSISKAQVAQIEQDFLLRFPDGLQDPAWLALGKKHRSTLQAMALFDTALSQPTLAAAIAQRRYGEVIEACRQFVGHCTTISTFEKIAFRNYLAFGDVHEPFVRCLHALLTRCDAASFDDFVDVLLLCRHDKNANAAKWPLVTAFLAYSDPQQHVCVKPTTIKKLAARLGVDMAYQAQPAHHTYQCVQAMVAQFRQHSTQLVVDNNITAQAVMYCTV